MYFTYILYSAKLDKYYIGSTDNLERRLKEHNRGKSNFTRTGIPWSLVYSETYETRQEAYHREMKIKNRKNKEYIEKLIHRKQTEHPVL